MGELLYTKILEVNLFEFANANKLTSRIFVFRFTYMQLHCVHMYYNTCTIRSGCTNSCCGHRPLWYICQCDQVMLKCFLFLDEELQHSDHRCPAKMIQVFKGTVWEYERLRVLRGGGGGGQKDRDRERQRQRQRETETETERQRQRQTDRQKRWGWGWNIESRDSTIACIFVYQSVGLYTKAHSLLGSWLTLEKSRACDWWKVNIFWLHFFIATQIAQVALQMPFKWPGNLGNLASNKEM